MVSDNDKAHLGERLNGQHDPKDPDGLITVDDTPAETPKHEEASDEYPHVPGRRKSTPHDYDTEPI
jgi:hypothetical protein